MCARARANQPGYQYDLSLFHDYDCEITAYTYWGLLAFSFVLTLLVSLWVGCYGFNSRSAALRHVTWLSLLGQWIMVLYYVGIVFEQGVYEFSSFFWLVACFILPLSVYSTAAAHTHTRARTCNPPIRV